MENLNELKPVGKLSPFAHFCCTIGNLPTSYMISLTYEEQLLWLCNYLEKTVIPAVNTNAEAVAELQSLYNQLKEYVDNYFDNLDVQKEINNKLNKMVETGAFEPLLQTLFNGYQEQIDNVEQNINNNYDVLNDKININDLNKYDDIAKAFLSFSNLDMDKYEKALITAYNNNKYGAAKANYSLEDLQKEIEKIKIAKAKLDENINFSKFDIKGFADEIFKVTVDDLPLNKATSIEVSNILNKWKTGKLDDTMGAAEQIAKVMNDPEILKAINNKSLKVDKIDDFFKGFKDRFIEFAKVC